MIKTNKMRILHFTNIPLSVVQIKSGGQDVAAGGGWMSALLGRMLSRTDCILASAAFGKVRKIQSTHADGIDSFILPSKGDGNSAMERNIQACCDLVEKWKPDLIHIHGTENFYGLASARKMFHCPVVISLQGLLGPYAEWYHYFGNSPLLDIIRMHRWLELPLFRGHFWGFYKIRKRAERELKIIRGNHFFLGRTTWDKSYVKSLNPLAEYYPGGELLREAFWQKDWHLRQIKRHRIIFTNAGHPRKGAEVLLEAVKLLKPEYPELQLAFAGTISHRSGYGRYLRKKMNLLGDVVCELGALNARQMADELTKSHVFVSPSFIDNSPNAVCEAQLVGMPVISSYTGGVPSLIRDGYSGLFFPTGDAPTLATRIRQIFEDDTLAQTLGRQGCAIARQRHAPDHIVNQIISVYKEILEKTK